MESVLAKGLQAVIVRQLWTNFIQPPPKLVNNLCPLVICLQVVIQLGGLCMQQM